MNSRLLSVTSIFTITKAVMRPLASTKLVSRKGKYADRYSAVINSSFVGIIKGRVGNTSLQRPTSGRLSSFPGPLHNAHLLGQEKWIHMHDIPRNSQKFHFSLPGVSRGLLRSNYTPHD